MTIIRRATIKDYEKIAEFSKQVVLYHSDNRPDIIKSAPDLSKREFKETIKDKNWIALIAENGGQAVGYCKALVRDIGDDVWAEMKMIFIYEMYVDPSYRRKGIANGLLDEIKKIANEIGATQVELDVWSFNESAISLYEKFGFTPQRLKMELKL